MKMNHGIAFPTSCLRVTHDKTYNKSCASSEDSDQPAHPRSLHCLHAPSKASVSTKRDKRDSLPHWVDVEVDLSLCWSHRSYCRFCRALAQM